ncbi:hypothetical protein ACFS5M_13975 [Lacinutrix iliipiscaria]|uniref:Uncharacterized protein n=1 Tax=Lacinutrix iliipiscaria TaxID=1230532 RepID=A0ABW5WU15_9FLAO
MKQIFKPINLLKFGILAFCLTLILSVVYSVKTSNKAELQVTTVQEKVDFRFKSYDNLFFHTNSIVVDSLGNKIGDIYILTNDKEINKFYSDTTREKTQYYYNLINRHVKIKEKQ